MAIPTSYHLPKTGAHEGPASAQIIYVCKQEIHKLPIKTISYNHEHIIAAESCLLLIFIILVLFLALLSIYTEFMILVHTKVAITH